MITDGQLPVPNLQIPDHSTTAAPPAPVRVQQDPHVELLSTSAINQTPMTTDAALAVTANTDGVTAAALDASGSATAAETPAVGTSSSSSTDTTTAAAAAIYSSSSSSADATATAASADAVTYSSNSNSADTTTAAAVTYRSSSNSADTTAATIYRSNPHSADATATAAAVTSSSSSSSADATTTAAAAAADSSSSSSSSSSADATASAHVPAMLSAQPMTVALSIIPKWTQDEIKSTTRAASLLVMLYPPGTKNITQAPFRFAFNVYSVEKPPTLGGARGEEVISAQYRALLWNDGKPFDKYKHCLMADRYHFEKEIMPNSIVFSSRSS